MSRRFAGGMCLRLTQACKIIRKKLEGRRLRCPPAHKSVGVGPRACLDRGQPQGVAPYGVTARL